MNTIYELLVKWMSGEPVTYDGKLYVFPHGSPKFLQLLKDYKRLRDG